MKRFYEEVSTRQSGDGWQVLLDGRSIKSQGGTDQIVPTSQLADLLAAEWSAQGEEIDPRSFVYRDMADYAIDVIRNDPGAAITNLVGFSQTDTLCYRAAPEDALFAKQEEMWEPLVTACEARHGITFARVSGVVHDPQKPETTQALQKLIEAQDEFTLAGLQTLTALAASIVIGLAALEDDANAIELFAASNFEEDWQAEQWGWEESAETARVMRLQAFRMAHDFVKAARAAG